jgi:hypothetical protein
MIFGACFRSLGAAPGMMPPLPPVFDPRHQQRARRERDQRGSNPMNDVSDDETTKTGLEKCRNKSACVASLDNLGQTLFCSWYMMRSYITNTNI